MRSLKFGYVLHGRRNIPLIPLSLRTGGKWMEFWAYVDSGAFYTIFDDKISEILDIDLIKGRKVFGVVGDGGHIPIYLHKIGVKIENDEFA